MKKEINKKNILKQTAFGYDMPEDEVEKIYNNFYGTPKFHEELENYIKNRGKNE